MSKYADDFIEQFRDTTILKRHTLAFNLDRKIRREHKLADKNLTKILKKKK